MKTEYYMKRCFRLMLLVAVVMCMPATGFAHEWQGKWIQAVDCMDSTNTWQVFRKTFKLGKKPVAAVARIAVDSKYWLYVNGELVVFEGGLKRGPSPKDTYYDEVDLSAHLRKGSNTIALLTVYFGREGFSHNSSGHAALLFDADVDGRRVTSDETWEAMVYEAYGTLTSPTPNWRLTESNICYDARKAIEGWQMPKSKVQLPKARVYSDNPLNDTYGQLVLRPIPLFKDYGLKAYASVSYDRSRTLLCALPYDAQVTPYMRLRAHAGDTIRICTDHAVVGREHAVTAAYVARDGEQEYESLGWMNGDSVYYTVPEGVEILDVKYRETGYDTRDVSGFSCDDEFFNELWRRSVRTMYVNMRDNYFDCPDRERALWWGDVANDIQQSFYVFDRKAWLLATKGIHELMNWQRPDGIIYSPIPETNWKKELPCQMLMAIGWYGFRHQAFYSGDYSFIRDNYDGIHRYLHDVWQTDDDGFAIPRPGGWDFVDWGRHYDRELITAAWYYLALKAEREYADTLGRKGDVRMITRMMEKMERNFDRRFWKGDQYRSDSYKDSEADDRAQALAVLCGMVPEDRYPALLRVFDTSRHASPWLELYVQLALFKMGHGDFAIERARERYGQMLRYKDKTTLFEYWQLTASTNHGWSSGMTAILGQEVCGIKPTSPGFRTFEVRPCMTSLRDIRTNVETAYGTISVHLTRGDDGRIKLEMTAPNGTTATVHVNGNTHIVEGGGQRILF